MAAALHTSRCSASSGPASYTISSMHPRCGRAGGARDALGARTYRARADLGGRPLGPRMPCGWRCGARVACAEMRKHFTACPRRPKRRQWMKWACPAAGAAGQSSPRPRCARTSRIARSGLSQNLCQDPPLSSRKSGNFRGDGPGRTERHPCCRARPCRRWRRRLRRRRRSASR